MQTDLSARARDEPELQGPASVVRKCVRCGFCTATCPTYMLSGDERDSPRGRIYLAKRMLEGGGAPDAEVVHHLDRCLSCLACEPACPSGVEYRKLISYARVYIEKNFRRPFGERVLRTLIAHVFTRPALFRTALALGRWSRAFHGWFPAPMRRLARALPAVHVASTASPSAMGSNIACGARHPVARILLLRGCVQDALAPQVNAAAVRLLRRLGTEVEEMADAGCCGALPYHLGREDRAMTLMRSTVRAFAARSERLGADGFSAVVSLASGCGAHLRDYGEIMARDPALAAPAAALATRVRDITEVLEKLEYPVSGAATQPRPTVAFHAPCTLQHAQRICRAPEALLARAGFEVRAIQDAHLCCGSAGTHSIFQSDIADALGRRKFEAIAASGAAVVATSNIGCQIHLDRYGGPPVLHLIELLDWAAGGLQPQALRRIVSL